MNKKQRNRKIVLQNKRNRMINRRYSSTIKTLSKLFYKKTEIIKEISNKSDSTVNVSNPEKNIGEISKIVNNLYGMIDKAVKKRVLHKNTASRKKSKIGQIFFKVRYS